MRRIPVLIASAAINASTSPAVATEKDVDASWAHSAMVHSQAANATDNEKACRAYAASSYESVMLRQAAAIRVDGERMLLVLDTVINALSTTCWR